MNATETYQGWKNYETWAVNLWIGNDEDSHRRWADAAGYAWQRAKPTSVWSRSESARYALADTLKDHHAEHPLTEEPSVYSDLLNAALSEVDWAEVADGLLSDCEGYESLDA